MGCLYDLINFPSIPNWPGLSFQKSQFLVLNHSQLIPSFPNNKVNVTWAIITTHILPQVGIPPPAVAYSLLWHFLGILDCFLDHFGWKYGYFTPRPLNQSRVKYQYSHQKKSRKWTNIPKKRVRRSRRSRKSVWGSRKRVQERVEVSWNSRKSARIGS